MYFHNGTVIALLLFCLQNTNTLPTKYLYHLVSIYLLHCYFCSTLHIILLLYMKVQCSIQLFCLCCLPFNTGYKQEGRIQRIQYNELEPHSSICAANMAEQWKNCKFAMLSQVEPCLTVNYKLSDNVKSFLFIIYVSLTSHRGRLQNVFTISHQSF